MKEDQEPTAFRLAERKYRFYKKPKTVPVYDDVVDFCGDYEDERRVLIERLNFEGRELSVFTLQGKEGFYFIPNALSIPEQATWVHRSLSEYPKSPNFSNLGLCTSPLWQEHLQSPHASQLDKLRWVTLGYHYNWTTNIYENTPERISHFPSEIIELCKHHASEFIHNHSFTPEAGIVNYYHANQSMMKAHQDESEFTFKEPIFSYSLGCTSIFLLGDISTDVEPTPLWMRSGDLMIMGGASRVFYHGVARIFPETCPKELVEEVCEEIGKYLNSARINLNIRQVFPSGKKNEFLGDVERKSLLLAAMDASHQLKRSKQTTETSESSLNLLEME